MRIEGRTFLVTGGRSGLGEATAYALEEAGATVVIADLPETDVTDEEGVSKLIDSLDVLHGAVNCAGVGGGARVVGKGKEGQSTTTDELREFLAGQFAKWWLPDRIEFVGEIPKTAVGKFRKTALREQFVGAPVAASGT